MLHSIEDYLREKHPDAQITVLPTDDTGPYKVYTVTICKRVFAHNDNYPENNKCLCGHAYYRHFDPYENWSAVGCKHCGCDHFIYEDDAKRLSPFARMQQFGQWHVRLEDYMTQWDMFAYLFYPTLGDYLGATEKEWTDIITPCPRQNVAHANDDDFVEVVVE